MNLFENENIKKGWKSKKNFLYIAFGIIIVAILSYMWGLRIVEDKTRETYDLEEVITSKATSKENIKVKLKITGKPILLAEKSDPSAAYYIVYNDKYYYIAKMSKAKAATLSSAFSSNENELVGYTSEVPEEVKQFAIDDYNVAFADQLENKLTISDYDRYFGDVCIDLVKDESALAPFQYIVFYLGLIGGIVAVIVAIVMLIVYKIKMKKMNKEDAERINQEIYSGEAIFFEKGQIYLTKSYLFDVANLQYFKYEDIFWVYKHIQRVNGFVSYKCLMVTTNNGKQAMVALNARDNYEKIMEELVARNSAIRLGFTPENKEAFKELKKKLKSEKKNKAS